MESKEMISFERNKIRRSWHDKEWWFSIVDVVGVLTETSRSRNPLLFSLLQRIDLVEHVGSGIKRIRQAMKEAGLREPIFEFGTFFIVSFKRPDWIGENVPEEGSEKSSEKSSEKILKIIAENPNASAKEIANSISLTQRAVEKQISKLKDKGLIKRIGPDKGGYWRVKR